jgi:hypothetical protein
MMKLDVSVLRREVYKEDRRARDTPNPSAQTATPSKIRPKQYIQRKTVHDNSE